MARPLRHVSKPVPEVRFWALFAVVFALVSQALLPIQALAMPQRDGNGFVLCTGDAAAVKSDPAKPHKGMMGLKCADCVMASITAVETAPPAALPARCAVPHAAWRPAADTASVKARAPPRPHSCGPPASETVA